MKRAMLALAVVAAFHLPASAIEDNKRDEKIMNSLLVAMTDKEGQLHRGGGKEHKSLGFYRAGVDVVFRSGYPFEPAKEMAEFAYDLHQFILAKGGGYNNWVKYVKEHPQDNKAFRDPYLNDGSNSDPMNPDARAHVAYAEQRAFAENWWKDRCANYRDTLLSQDWWLNDAILDANKIWYTCANELYPPSADHLLWQDGEMQKLAAKK